MDGNRVRKLIMSCKNPHILCKGKPDTIGGSQGVWSNMEPHTATSQERQWVFSELWFQRSHGFSGWQVLHCSSSGQLPCHLFQNILFVCQRFSLSELRVQSNIAM